MHKTVVILAAASMMFAVAPLTVAGASAIGAKLADQASSSRPSQPVPRTGAPGTNPDGAQDMLRTRDRSQDRDCDQTKDCTAPLDGPAEPDRDRDRGRLIDPDADQDRDRDRDRLVDPDADQDRSRDQDHDRDQDKLNEPGSF